MEKRKLKITTHYKRNSTNSRKSVKKYKCLRTTYMMYICMIKSFSFQSEGLTSEHIPCYPDYMLFYHFIFYSLFPSFLHLCF